jgi:hypothetical protein
LPVPIRPSSLGTAFSNQKSDTVLQRHPDGDTEPLASKLTLTPNCKANKTTNRCHSVLSCKCEKSWKEEKSTRNEKRARTRRNDVKREKRKEEASDFNVSP